MSNQISVVFENSFICQIQLVFVHIAIVGILYWEKNMENSIAEPMTGNRVRRLKMFGLQ